MGGGATTAKPTRAKKKELDSLHDFFVAPMPSERPMAKPSQARGQSLRPLPESLEAIF